MGSKQRTSAVDLRNDEALDDEVLAGALGEADLDAGGTAKERADRLEAHYLALTPPVGWDPKPVNKGGNGSWHLTCEIEAGGCGYTSTARQDFCVFCGDGKPAPEPEIAATSAAMVVAKPEESVVEAEFLEEENDLPAPDGDPSGTVEDLDRAVDAINALERNVTGSEWDLGHAIYSVFKRTLYVARKKDGGGPKYSSWAQFCAAELRMSSATANRYMRIAVNFPRELAQDLGPSKLVELLPAAEAQAAEQENAARFGREPKLLLPPLIDRARVLDVRELRVEVRAAVPRPAPATGRAKGAQAAAEKRLAAKQPEPERITVQRQEGVVKLRWFADERAARANDTKKHLKKFAEGMVAIELAVNGVEVVYTLRMDGKRGPILQRVVNRVE